MVQDRSLHELELAFFGTITASISHELNNVLSIINEYSGLIDDLVSLDDNTEPFEKDRIQKIALNIADQLKRERDLIKLLNRFAHRVDVPIVQFVFNDLVHDIIRLTQRFASLKKVSLEVTLPQEPINMTNNPFGVQHAIFSCLNLALDLSNSNDNICTNIEVGNSQVIINVTSRPIDQNEPTVNKMEIISLIVENVGGNINTVSLNESNNVIRVYIPLAKPDRIGSIEEDSINEH